MTDGWMNSYQARVNAETLARQAPDRSKNRQAHP